DDRGDGKSQELVPSQPGISRAGGGMATREKRERQEELHVPESRAQLTAARTARCHPAIDACAAARPSPGTNRVYRRAARNASALGQTPAAIPASAPAPIAVVSITSGRSTGTPSTSA